MEFKVSVRSSFSLRHLTLFPFLSPRNHPFFHSLHSSLSIFTPSISSFLPPSCRRITEPLILSVTCKVFSFGPAALTSLRRNSISRLERGAVTPRFGSRSSHGIDNFRRQDRLYIGDGIRFMGSHSRKKHLIDLSPRVLSWRRGEH